MQEHFERANARPEGWSTDVRNKLTQYLHKAGIYSVVGILFYTFNGEALLRQVATLILEPLCEPVISISLRLFASIGGRGVFFYPPDVQGFYLLALVICGYNPSQEGV